MSLLDAIENHTAVSPSTYLDSRELIRARDEAQALLSEHESADSELGVLDDDEIAELREIVDGVTDIENEGGGEDWQYGSCFIPEHEWIDYVQDYASDVCGVDGNGQWPTNHIDWEAAADELAMDYSQVDIDGTTYYVR